MTNSTHVMGVELLKLIVRSKDPLPAKFYCQACKQKFTMKITPTSPRPRNCTVCNSEFIEWLLPEDPHHRAARLRESSTAHPPSSPSPSPSPSPPPPPAPAQQEEPMETEPTPSTDQVVSEDTKPEPPLAEATPTQEADKTTGEGSEPPAEAMEEETSAPPKKTEPSPPPAEEEEEEEEEEERPRTTSRLSSQPMVVISAGGEIDNPTLTMNLFPSLDEAGPRKEGRKGPLRTVIIQQKRSRNFNYLAQEYMAQIMEGGGSGPGGRPRRGHQLLVGLTGGAQSATSDPADFVWGARGLDSIISSLLDSMSDRGPPPAKKEIIDAIPIIEATEEIVAEHADGCTVCKEVFKVGESLKKLPCDHLFHDNCVIKWLKQHDTCPTCRYHVNKPKSDQPAPETVDQ